MAPFVKGLRLGQLVEITSLAGGQLGQLTDYDSEDGMFSVSMIDTGDVVRVDVSSVVAPGLLSAPGEGGGSDSFDVVVGPRTDRGALGETLSHCLSNKGFCVLKIIQGTEDRARALEDMKAKDADGKLGRLAAEVEEGYLGRGTRGKVMWLDPEESDLPSSSLLIRNDSNITTLAEILQSNMEDSLGAVIAERTPAMACLSMSDRDEAEYEPPAAADEDIEEFYSTWVRSVARVVHFMGSAAGKVTLTPKGSSPLSNLESEYELIASANTMVILREDTFDYSYEEPDEGEACWLQSFFLKAGPDWSLEEVEGDTSLLGAVGAGPPPPNNSANNLVAVTAISIQSCGKMTDHHKEWAAYSGGCDGQLEMPFTRFDYWPYYDEEVDMPQGTTFVKHFSVQDGIELFDNRIFEISNMEAEAMDPQARQVLEVGYLSILQMGITKKYCNTNPIHASVSVGCDKQEWLNLAEAPRNVATNNQLAILANRFNYVFNLKGGSYACDTACSSSLVAGHLGKMNLLERRWDPLEWHLGFGTGITMTVFSFTGGSASHMLSPGGRCFTFNATANGYNRGDGTAGMLIKAGTCEEHRMCYFRGSQIGQDGRSASMAAPNGPAQEKCTWGAIREAQMTPPESTVWECHGTGTSLGDPIEVGAVRKVQIKMKRIEPLMVASSKSNFGHLEGSAAAIAMNKCVMVVIKITCMATQHVKTLNPHLDHAAFDAIFCVEHLPYKYKQGHCQVSSFGVGGTNGHAIFWGEGYKPPPDYRRQLMDKVKKLSGSKIIVNGNDPSTWEYSGIAYDSKPTDNYAVVFTKDPITGQEVLRYEKTVVEEEEVDPIEFYSTTGNHNDWSEDRMMEGDVAGLWYQELEIPEGGKLEFRIMGEGDTTKMIGPESTTDKRIGCKIMGPSSNISTSWVVNGAEGAAVRIEFFAPLSTSKGAEPIRSISWIVAGKGSGE
jgi:polyketide synthase-associated protein